MQPTKNAMFISAVTHAVDPGNRGNSRDLEGVRMSDSRRRSFGTMILNAGLLEDRDVLDNSTVGLRLCFFSTADCRDPLDQAIDGLVMLFSSCVSD
jgi:hypothetical protein